MSLAHMRAAIKANASLDELEALAPSLGDNSELLAIPEEQYLMPADLVCLNPAPAAEIAETTAEPIAAPSGGPCESVPANSGGTPAAPPVLTLSEKQALRKDLTAMVSTCTDADVLTSMLVPKLDLATCADAHKPLRAAIKTAVQAKLKELTGAKPTAADMKELFPEVAKKLKQKPRHVSLTHFGVAQRVQADMAGDLRYNIDQQKWLNWDGCRWVNLRNAQVQTIARHTVNKIKAHAATLSDVDMDKLEHSDSDSFRRGVVGEMVALERVHLEQLDLDQHAGFMACGNGAIDLATGNLVCERDLLVTVRNDTDFDPDAKAPLFMRILGEMFEQRVEDISYYELIMGYSIQANPSERAMFFHKGEGTNGKSLMLGAIMKALGDYAVTTNYKLIADGPGSTMNGSADGPSPSLRRLMGTRIAYIDEIPVGGNLRDADVKRFAGGAGTLDARGLGQETVEFLITFVFHISCNTMATVRNGQLATFKRAFPVVYTKQFDAVEDSTLAEKLDMERAGILAWLVRCSLKSQAMRARGEKLRDHMPQSAKDALESIKSEQNPFTAWLDENCERGEGYVMPVQEAWDDYMRHEERVNKDASKVAARSVRKFTQLMKAFNIGRHDEQVMFGKRRAAGFWGWRLRTDVVSDLQVSATATEAPATSPASSRKTTPF